MKKNLLIFGLILIVLGLALNTIFNWFTLSKDERIAKESLSPKNDTITLREYITKDSTIVMKYEPNLGQLLQNNVTKKYYSYVSDTLAPALKIATNKISEAQQVKAKLEGQVQSLKSELNSEKTRTIYYKDKYFSATTKTDTLGNSSMAYNYDAQLDVITTLDKRFIGKDIQTVSITSPDRNLKINGVEHYKKSVTMPPKKVGLGLQVGYGVTGDGKLVPYMGAGVSYNFIRL